MRGRVGHGEQRELFQIDIAREEERGMTTIKVLAVNPHPRHPDWWVVSFDDHEPLTLDGGAIVAEGIVPERAFQPEEVERFAALAEERSLLDLALRFLAVRPRSRREVRMRLLRPRRNRTSAPPEVVDRVLARLEQQGLLDDKEFAAYWVEQRERFSPRAAYALGQELRQRGVARETAAEVADPDRDLERALAAARSRARTLRLDDYRAFREKLGSFLLRRGFSYGIAREVVSTLWGELGGNAETPGNDEAAGSEDVAAW